MSERIDFPEPPPLSTAVTMTSCHCLGCLHGVHCGGKACREGC